MKKISLLLICLLIIPYAKAQNIERPITTGVPFLLVAADARAAGLADQGVATSADAYSQQWNPAKYAFSVDKQGFSISYTPYLTDLANDISLGQATYYNKINDRSAFAGSFRYFGFGGIELRQTGDPTEPVREVTPNEFALDGSYSLKLSEEFSMAVGARFINSNLKVASENVDAKAASSFAVDIAAFYQSEEIAYTDFNGRWRAGFNFQNMGPKISYDNDEINNNFLPANMRLGMGFDFVFDEYNKVGVTAEVTKLLVPTPPALVAALDSNGTPGIQQDEQDTADDAYRLGDGDGAHLVVLAQDAAGLFIFIGVVDVFGGEVVLDNLVFDDTHTGFCHGHLGQGDTGIAGGQGGGTENLVYLLLREAGEFTLGFFDAGDQCIQFSQIGYCHVYLLMI